LNFLKTLAESKKHLIVMLLGLILGLIFFIIPVLGFSFEYFPGDLADGRLNLYFLEHDYKFFTGQLTSLWDAPFMFPEKNTLAFSDNLLGSAPIYSFFRLIGNDIYFSYQLWYLTISILNYISAFILLKYLFKNNYVAIIGAFIFAFSIALNTQIAHAQTFPRFAIPLAIFMVVKFREKLNANYFFLSIFTIVYQIYCGIYLGFMLVIPTLLFLTFTIIEGYIYHKNKILKLSWHLKIVLGMIINIILLAPLMLPYLERKITANAEHFNEIFSSIPTIGSYLFSQQDSLLWWFLSETGIHYKAYWDHQIFAGAIASLSFIAAVCIVIKKRIQHKELPSQSLLIMIGLLTFLLFLRFESYTAYKLIYFIPGFNSMRSVTRIINVELLFFAIATSYVLYQIYKTKKLNQGFVFSIALILIIIDNYSLHHDLKRTKVSDSTKRTRIIEASLSKLPKNAIVSYEPITLNSNPNYYQVDAMLMAQKYDLRCVNAYSANTPVEFYEYWGNPSRKWRNYWLSGKNIVLNEFYVVNESYITKLNGKELENELLTEDEKKFLAIISNMTNDTNWMNLIKKEALRDNISVDSAMILNAKWTLLQEKLQEKKLQNLIVQIKNDPKWMEDIRRKAKNKGIPVDSVILINAKWVLSQQN